MCRYARRTKLWQDQVSMFYHFAKTDSGNFTHKLISPESALACRAPDIDTFCVQYQNSRIKAVYRFPQMVETQPVVCRYENRRVFIGVSNRIETRITTV